MKIPTSNKPVLLISGQGTNKLNSDLLKKAYQVFVTVMNIPDHSIVSLVLCSSEEMCKINKKYRGTENTTDVLSFPSESISKISTFEKNKETYLGEILIDIKYIIEHRDSNNMDKEITRVFVHGLLHLVGFDHLNTIQKEKMHSFEHKIINKIEQDGLSER